MDELLYRRTCWWWAVLLLALLLAGCRGNANGDAETESLQETVITGARFDLLTDDTYYMPANQEEEDETVFLPLRKWDLIFAGSVTARSDDPGRDLAGLVVPGRFDHLLVYIGKDEEGFAYAVDVQMDAIALQDGDVATEGGVHFLCLGVDFGQTPHPSGRHLFDRDYYSVRWAKRLDEQPMAKLRANERTLEERIRADIFSGFPYQPEVEIALNDLLFSRQVRLVDDGLTNGAGCSDYWTALFEQHAGVCLQGVRMGAAEITDYFLYDPRGRQAYVPAELNPLGTGELNISEDLLGTLGFVVVEDEPHRYSCDGTEEGGLVVPERIFANEQLVDIQPVQEF